ncbi:hypothetical protein [Mycobacteroides saopaulense]|uniref:Uncharacterized protein n=1 Tax=Mycobacteroides saopaulense TaxID=1578165 RepID=A0ABX3BWG6_9MYCO|nr:hypothetical protein [Mycobacteroides saopaulense]OHT81170.1 hypothetical protein BKG68_23290 [Mycobacteroides saopaulense]OHU07319.1 hypothetical protein BKG73_18895 [Mycobacteroides saopaulense]
MSLPQVPAHFIASSRNDSIVLLANERGLPIRLKLDASEMSRPPELLAQSILELCKLSAMRQQVARRKQFEGSPYSAAICRSLRLATEQELADAEEAQFADD